MTPQSRSRSTAPDSEQSRIESAELSKDQVFHVLSVQRRRCVLRYLADHDGAVSMRDIAEQVAAWEHDTTVDDLRSDERQRVYIALYQTHLPKLDEYGIIDYNQPRGVVERTERAARFDQYVREESETARENRDSDGRVQGDHGTAETMLDSSGAVMALARPIVVGTIGATVLIAGRSGFVSAWLLLAITWVAIVAVLVLGSLGSSITPPSIPDVSARMDKWGV